MCSVNYPKKNVLQADSINIEESIHMNVLGFVLVVVVAGLAVFHLVDGCISGIFLLFAGDKAELVLAFVMLGRVLWLKVPTFWKDWEKL